MISNFYEIDDIHSFAVIKNEGSYPSAKKVFYIFFAVSSHNGKILPKFDRIFLLYSTLRRLAKKSVCTKGDKREDGGGHCPFCYSMFIIHLLSAFSSKTARRVCFCRNEKRQYILHG